MDTITLKIFCEFVEQRYHLCFDEKNEQRLIFTIKMRTKVLRQSPFEYLQFIKTNKEEEELFINEITIGETYFFRYRNVFEYIKSILSGSLDTKQLRILHIGCATGEEPYSMAMVLEQLNIQPSRGKIYAVDIDSVAIEKAHRGMYKKLRLQYLTPVERSKYFYLKEDNWFVSNMLKKYVTFYSVDLFDLNTSSLKQKYDIIFCMNVMIYFSSENIENSIKLLMEMATENTLIFTAPTDPILAMNKYFQVQTQQNFHWYNLKKQNANNIEFPFGVMKNTEISFSRNLCREQSYSKTTFNSSYKKKQLESASTSSEIETQHRLTLAQQAYTDKDFDTAILLYNQEIKTSPAESYLGLAKVYADQGKILLAAKNLDLSLKYDESNYRTYLLLGVIHSQMNDLSQAKEYLRVAQKLQPGNNEVQAFLTFLEKTDE